MNILKFFGSWCNPCKALSKNLEDAGIEHKSIDVDDNEIGRIIGPRTKEQLLEELKNYEVQSSEKDNL